MTQRIGPANGNSQDNQGVVDFKQAREQRLKERRRQTERIFFRNLLSVYSVMNQAKLVPIELIEVSEEGCSFQIPHDPDNRWPRDANEIPVRFYFSAESYFEINFKIQNSRPSIDGHRRCMRFGCSVDQAHPAYAVYQYFVKFLKEYTENAQRDRGEMSIFYF